MESEIINQFIRSLNIIRKDNNDNKYPFCLPIIRNLNSLKFHPKVTFIVGENGSGKSTLLEAIAVNYGFNPEGGTKNFNFSTMDSHSELYDYINLVKGIKKPKDGFFLRAESLYNVASNIDELDKESCGGPKIIDSYGGTSLHKQSHGESFFSIFINKFSERGLYILDEPEAALSPSRQMAMITRIHELVNSGSQFIIATHSPILMAYPNAIIYEIDDKGIKEVEYEESQHYQITKAFLSNTSKFLDILIDE
ncbi:ATP-binding cassette domain-containing protein [Romboutsia weinsteinii]|uniref:ATP-binding cassette domain-containing protein n=1 Tax=Romboutsia weinsteinii TaxID=2020949 RepID=A0A371J889_9FIRM|nr:AAA family ATPase [Romboutsia weinsteinii]RDY28991.1 ATP-binding cassette domain-containing protein [Romboutsia weinsteinii]